MCPTLSLADSKCNTLVVNLFDNRNATYTPFTISYRVDQKSLMLSAWITIEIGHRLPSEVVHLIVVNVETGWEVSAIKAAQGPHDSYCKLDSPQPRFLACSLFPTIKLLKLRLARSGKQLVMYSIMVDRIKTNSL